MKFIRDLKYRMGFKVNGEPTPDPSVYTGKASALDAEGGRDATGTLHRAMVATKHPIKLEYHGITFATMEEIMGKLRGESFQFTMPDPLEGTITIKAYCGDRDWTTEMATEEAGTSAYDADWKRGWLGNLNFSVIEF